ncbi:glycosyltransferase [Vibrio fluvialis]|uniref:glycosyltransferase n=1 Tax=Vibrio fluvialis TaxID=676 RepID=UPI002573E67E|nr:glycosyltransferase [Vibrio fluvialis]BEI22393.1 glycosyltransferase [Vibrio fluvialis]
MKENHSNAKSQQDIISRWLYKEKVYTSILCTAFNQEEYIESAIVGFLEQETDYRFEIIIHDDCSNDNTKAILKSFKSKYPDIIKLILQEENQYSINAHRPFSNLLNNASGDFVALCEGDDYWVSKNKLDVQIKLMIERQDVDISFHPCYHLYPDTTYEIKNTYSSQLTLVSCNQVIKNGGSFIPTASIMFRKSKLNLPAWFYEAPVGDYYIQVLCASPNGALFIPDIFSCYRYTSIGSWSEKTKTLYDSKLVVSKAKKYCDSLNALNKHLEYNFSSEINYYKVKEVIHCAFIAFSNNDYSTCKKILRSVDFLKIRSVKGMLFYLSNINIGTYRLAKFVFRLFRV